MTVVASPLVEWPLRYGPVPPLADGHNPRPETGLGGAGQPDPGGTVILTAVAQPGLPPRAAPGGSGKTQLAAALANSLWDSRSVDLLVWISGTSREAILTGYAGALAEAGAADPADDLAAAAQRFLRWLAGAALRWLVVLDDVPGPAELEGLWPRGVQGRVVVTTEQPDFPAGPDRRIVPVAGYSTREALAYLTARLSDESGQRVGALDLAADLDCQPLALAQATAVLICTEDSCHSYRGWFADRKLRMSRAAGAAPSAAEVTCLLSMELAEQMPPAGLARPALALASLLDPAGIPGAVFTTPAAAGYLAGPGQVADPAQAKETVYSLFRAGLVTINPASATRTVQVHPLVRALSRATTPAAEFGPAVRAAADALVQAWPAGPAAPRLAQALHDCAGRLRDAGGDLLWAPDPHPVLLRAGQSMASAALSGPAIAYWQALQEESSRVLGATHVHTLCCLDGLAAAFELAGRIDDAIDVHERVLAQRQEQLGHDHPDTLTSRGHLAHAFTAGGRPADALPLHEKVAADREWVLGARHPDTLAARTDLAAGYLAAGRPEDAVPVYQQALADAENGLGPGHPDTLSARAALAHAYRTMGRHKQAVSAYEQVLAGRAKAQGPDHPDTLSARADLAYAYRVSGQLKRALPQYEHTLADRERVLGAAHPDTLTARANLANAYLAARRVKDAIPHYERTLQDRELAQGADHPDTLTARGNLANAYHSAGRLHDALPLYEQTLADSERTLGPADQVTLTARANLGSAYHAALRLTDAISVFERTLTDCELALGQDHPLTCAVRENLEAASKT